MIQHLGDHVPESIRQGAAAYGTNFNAAHAVDAQIVIGLAGVIQRNGANGTLLSTCTALNTAFVCRRVESGGFQFLVGVVSGDMNRFRIVRLCHHIGGKPAADGWMKETKYLTRMQRKQRMGTFMSLTTGSV